MKFKDMNELQKKVFCACCSGWYLGGTYKATFDDHERTFFADSLPWLFHDVQEWLDGHAAHHTGANLLVKFGA